MKWQPFKTTPGADYIVLLRFLGWVVRLHRFRIADGPWYHSHPAFISFRLILRGGYIEEFPDKPFQSWRPGRWGFVFHDTLHRIADIHGETCITLWIRSPKRYSVKVVDK